MDAQNYLRARETDRAARRQTEGEREYHVTCPSLDTGSHSSTPWSAPNRTAVSTETAVMRVLRVWTQ